MGKKILTLNQASLKTSKHQKKHQQQRQQQQQFDSLINVLRPKVYITDTSCFKKLVQELTGNGTAREHDDHPLLCHESSKKVITALEKEDHHHHRHHHGGDDSDQYFSNQTSSSMSSDGVSNRQVFDGTYSFEEELMTLGHSTSNSDLMVDSLSPGGASVSKSASFSCEDHELWLPYMEPAAPFFNGLAQLEPEVSIYDYEVSGLF